MVSEHSRLGAGPKEVMNRFFLVTYREIVVIAVRRIALDVYYIDKWMNSRMSQEVWGKLNSESQGLLRLVRLGLRADSPGCWVSNEV